jgi:hypothetical protein
MRINEHQKKGCEKVMDFEGNYLKLKLYPQFKNIAKGVYIVYSVYIPKASNFSNKISCFNYHSELDSMFQHSISSKGTCYDTST